MRPTAGDLTTHGGLTRRVRQPARSLPRGGLARTVGHPVRTIALVWAAWLGVLLLVVALATWTGLLERPVGQPGGLLWPLVSWDTGWYAHVAADGYPSGTGGREYAFFPLWPALLHAVDAGHTWLLALLLALVASLAAFLAITLLDPFNDTRRSAVALACFPGSFALALAYPDGLALAAAAGACLLARLRHAPAAAALAALATLARPSGVLVAIPLLAAGGGPLRRRAALAAAPALALAGVWLWFWASSGSPTAFTDAQRLWGRSGPGALLDWLTTSTTRTAIGAIALLAGLSLAILARRRPRLRRPAIAAGAAVLVAVALLGAHSEQTRVESLRVAFSLALLALAWASPRPWRPWALYATAIVALSLLSGTTLSFGRQSLLAFPLVWAYAAEHRLGHSRLALTLSALANIALLLAVARFAP